jgi:Tfp pilus assembly protein PilO
VTLPLQGSYGQLVGFLREVQRSPRFVTVDSVSMRAGREGDTALQVVLSAYLRRTEAARKEERPGRS